MEQVGEIIEDLTESELQMLFDQEYKEWFDLFYPTDDFMDR
jgi:hypothetical protein